MRDSNPDDIGANMEVSMRMKVPIQTEYLSKGDISTAAGAARASPDDFIGVYSILGDISIGVDAGC